MNIIHSITGGLVLPLLVTGFVATETRPSPASGGREDRQSEATARMDPGLANVHRVAVITFTTTKGNSDAFWTSLFIEELRERRPDLEIVDPLEVETHFDPGLSFNSLASVQRLLEAAKKAGADALLLGNGHQYSVGWRLETKLVEAANGTVLWSAAAASGWKPTGPSSKKAANHKVLKDFPRPGRTH